MTRDDLIVELAQLETLLANAFIIRRVIVDADGRPTGKVVTRLALMPKETR